MEDKKESKEMKKFIFIWIGELISSIESGMTAFAVAMYMYQTTGSAAMVSLATVLAFLPTILLSPIGGVLADRYDRRMLMIIGDLCSGLGLVYILWQMQIGNHGALPILIGITINAVFVALLDPAYKATVSDLLTEEEYAKASGMVQIADNARYLISPALAGVFLGIGDIRLILLLDICTFFVTVGMVAVIRKTIQKPQKREKKAVVSEIKDGWQVIAKKRGVRSLVFTMTGVCFFLGFIQTLSGPMVLAVSNERTVGILESVCAVGMLVGSVWIGMAGVKKNYVATLSIAGIVAGIGMAFAGVSTNILFTAGSIFLFFIAVPFMNTCADVMIRVNIPNELQGRAWGLISLLTQSGTALAYVLCGVLADSIFEPAMNPGGVFANSIGKVIGIGQGRGMGLLLIVAGIGMCVSSFIIGKNQNVKEIEPKSEGNYVQEIN